MTVSVRDSVAGLRVLFGHQSVGANVVDGIRDLQERSGGPGAWPIVEDSAEAKGGGFFAHVRVGRNGDPRSKTAAFGALARGAFRGRLDVALHKYCYADIDAGTDVAGLFESYRSAMRELAAASPDVAIVHVTVPLVRVRGGVRGWLRNAAGRTSPRQADNANRERFNDLLRREYAAGDLFDLAAAAAPASGPRSLRPDFTDDGGHLNARGRRAAAAGLLDTLARVGAAAR